MQWIESAVFRRAAAAASGRCRTSLLRPTSIFHRHSTAAQQVRLFHHCLSAPTTRSLRQTRCASSAPTPPPPDQQAKAAAAAAEDDEAGPTKKEMRKEVIQAEREAIAELSLYGRMKKYGPTAMLIYLAIHIAGFWLCFFLLMSGIEVCLKTNEHTNEAAQAARKKSQHQNKIKYNKHNHTHTSIPTTLQVRKYLAMIPYFPVLADKKSASDADSFMALFSFLPWAELGLALVINKIFSPLQVCYFCHTHTHTTTPHHTTQRAPQMLVTISITPRLAPILLSWGPTKAIVSFLNRLIARVKGTPVPPVV